MAIPFLIGGAALLAGVVGLGAGISAKEKWDKAESMVDDAKSDYEDAQKDLLELSEEVQESFVDLGQLKVDIFHNQIAHIVSVLSKTSGKSASSSISDFKNSLTMEDVGELQHQLSELDKLELSSEFGGGLMAGALASFGAYGTVGALATASTGTAIGTLSGVAATNATLAWLGGGSLAAGGFGIAGGTAVLGGIVAAPAILVAGLFMESKADEALTQAEEYVSDVKIAMAEMKNTEALLKALNDNAWEITYVLNQLVERFERVKVNDASDMVKYSQMLMVGKAIKEALNTPIVTKKGKAKQGVDVKCSGLLEVVSDI